jgi:hypothetical protein
VYVALITQRRHIYIYVYVCVWMCVCVCERVCVRLRVHTHTHTHTKVIGGEGVDHAEEAYVCVRACTCV